MFMINCHYYATKQLYYQNIDNE